jgi:GDP-L-fucose synthase
MTIWGSGKPFREFMHVDDCASGILFLLEHYSDYLHVNLGTGKDITIYDLALNIKQAVGFYGDIVCDLSKPDGTFRKCLDVSLLNNLGWQSKINFKDGLRETVNWFNKYVAEQS